MKRISPAYSLYASEILFYEINIYSSFPSNSSVIKKLLHFTLMIKARLKCVPNLRLDAPLTQAVTIQNYYRNVLLLLNRHEQL